MRSRSIQQSGSFGVEVQPLMIPTRDGTRLSATLFRPRTDRPVPCVVEYTPYRTGDFRGAARDFGHFYFAEQGIASVQLDVRGTGNSDGLVSDEYQYPQEQLDGVDALAYLAAQPWCTGRTGAWGTSYAGFAAFQIAQLQPPSLGAIAPIYASDDRFTDDMHFRGGALDGWSVIGSYALGMVTRNALPPYPDLAGPGWEDAWQRRLDGTGPWLIRWIEEQLDGPYWQTTLARMYSRVRVPTLIIGGWADFYVNSALRWMAHLAVPKKLIMGPWPHTPPDAATPGPRIDFLNEITRWWKQWLAGESTGILDEPPVTVFIQSSRPPGTPDVAPGSWRYEDALPPARMREQHWFLDEEGRLSTAEPQREHVAEREYVPYVGFADLERNDQRAQEEFSLVYSSAPLEAALEILGFPRAVVHLEADTDVAFCAVRLCDVAPNGTSTLVTKGLLNATRRNGMDRADPLVPGETYRLEIDLDAVSWIFPAGHRLRVAISGADFPEVWPSPQATRLRVRSGPAAPSRMTLPVVPFSDSRESEKGILRPPAPRRSRFTHEVAHPRVWTRYDPDTRTMHAEREGRETITHPDSGTVLTGEHRTTMRVAAGSPGTAVATGWDRRTLRRQDLAVECIASAELRGDPASFALDLSCDVTLNGAPYWSRRWIRTIPRLLL
ncbi:MAG: CocE/NonD family hydrolase [bacterium]